MKKRIFSLMLSASIFTTSPLLAMDPKEDDEEKKVYPVINHFLCGSHCNENPAELALMIKEMFSKGREFRRLDVYENYMSQAVEWNIDYSPIVFNEVLFAPNNLVRNAPRLINFFANINEINILSHALLGQEEIKQFFEFAFKKNPKIIINLLLGWNDRWDASDNLKGIFEESLNKNPDIRIDTLCNLRDGPEGRLLSLSQGYYCNDRDYSAYKRSVNICPWTPYIKIEMRKDAIDQHALSSLKGPGFELLTNLPMCDSDAESSEESSSS